MPDTTRSVADVLEHHLKAVDEESLQAIMEDYADDAVLFTPDGPVEGRKELRRFFDGFFKDMPDGWMDSFRMLRQDIHGDIAYLVWTADPFISLGTDTFLIRDGKIRIQSFAAHVPAG